MSFLYESIFITPNKKSEIVELPINTLYWIIIILFNITKIIFSIIYLFQTNGSLLSIILIVFIVKFIVYSTRNYIKFVSKFKSKVIKILMLALLIIESFFELPIVWVYPNYIYNYSNYRLIYENKKYNIINNIFYFIETFSVFIIYFSYKSLLNHEERYVVVPTICLISSFVLLFICLLITIGDIFSIVNEKNQSSHMKNESLRKDLGNSKKIGDDERRFDRNEYLKRINSNTDVEKMISMMNINSNHKSNENENFEKMNVRGCLTNEDLNSNRRIFLETTNKKIEDINTSKSYSYTYIYI